MKPYSEFHALFPDEHYEYVNRFHKEWLDDILVMHGHRIVLVGHELPTSDLIGWCLLVAMKCPDGYRIIKDEFGPQAGKLLTKEEFEALFRVYDARATEEYPYRYRYGNDDDAPAWGGNDFDDDDEDDGDNDWDNDEDEEEEEDEE